MAASLLQEAPVAQRSSSTASLSSLAKPASSNAARSHCESLITSSKASAVATTAHSSSEAATAVPSLQESTPKSGQPSRAPGSLNSPTSESVKLHLQNAHLMIQHDAEVEPSYVIQETQDG